MAEGKREDWTTTELAAAGEVDPSLLRYLLLHGKLQGRKRGGVWLIPDQAAQAWLHRKRKRQQKQAPTEP